MSHQTEIADLVTALRADVERVATILEGPNGDRPYPTLVNDLAPVYAALTHVCTKLLSSPDFDANTRDDGATAQTYANAVDVITDRLAAIGMW